MTDTTPAATVIVPTYNRAKLLRYTLESLVRQRLPREAFEVLVVDDGSTDDTSTLVADFGDRLDVRYFHQPDEGYRVARARNVGVANAAGDICVFVDSGVLLHSGALAAHLDTHRRGPGPLAVVGYVYCFNEDNEDGALIVRVIDPGDPDATIAMLAAEGRWLDIREGFYAKYGDDFADVPAPWLMLWSCNASAPTERIRSVGMFDEAYRSWGAEDVDLSYRLFLDGARFVLDRRASAIHHPHPKSYAENMHTVAGNYRYFAAKYGTPITQLIVNHHFHDINDVARERGLPSCKEYLAARGADRPGLTMVFAPHPDDEVIACGGTIIKRIAAGHRVVLVFCTDGSMSHAAVLGIHANPTRRELAEIRRHEAEEAAVRLGVGLDDVHFLGFEDTHLADSMPRFRAAVARILAAHLEVTEVYLPHETRELNADHRCTGEGVLACLAELGLAPQVHRYLIWDEQTEAEFAFSNRPPTPHPASADEFLVEEDISAQLPGKLAALAAHRTQVTLYAAGQTRPVVPQAFIERVCSCPTESFWNSGDHGSAT